MAQNPMDVHLVKIETNHSMPFRFCCNPICQMEIQKRIIYTITSCLPEIYIEWHQLIFRFTPNMKHSLRSYDVKLKNESFGLQYFITDSILTNGY